MRLFTIGFTEKSAEAFFGMLKLNRIELVVDIRLRPDGQLSGLAKIGDLPYFLRELTGCDYLHLPILAPEDALLKDYRNDKDWDRYVSRFERLMDKRQIPEKLDQAAFRNRACCLLCSEASPAKCHRRLIADRMAATWENVGITHLT